MKVSAYNIGNVWVLILFITGTAVPGEDFVISQSQNVLFVACQQEECVDITITNDRLIERDESIGIILSGISGQDSRIITQDAIGEVVIFDDDGMC